MDCKDLMIYDHVKYNGVTKIVDAVYLYSVSVHDPSEEWSISEAKTFPVDDIEPIKLTSEILVKNGFDIEPCGCVWYQEHGISEQNYIVVSFYKNGEVRKVELSFVNKVHGEFRGIYTLHQLQHLLRLCGIEKELVID
jgi:hypothetical protein